ncbi:MAG: hypothetical protein ACREOI_05935 [bacterium]
MNCFKLRVDTFDHQIHILQESNVSQHIAAHRDDVGVFAGADRAGVRATA